MEVLKADRENTRIRLNQDKLNHTTDWELLDQFEFRCENVNGHCSYQDDLIFEVQFWIELLHIFWKDHDLVLLFVLCKFCLDYSVVGVWLAAKVQVVEIFSVWGLLQQSRPLSHYIASTKKQVFYFASYTSSSLWLTDTPNVLDGSWLQKLPILPV